MASDTYLNDDVGTSLSSWRRTRQSGNFRSAQVMQAVSVQKTVVARINPFTQVLIVRILAVCGEVAERLKAAVLEFTERA